MRKEQPVVSVAGRQDRRRGDGRLGPASVCSCAGIASWPAALRSGHPQRPVGGDGSALHRQVSFVLLAFILVDSTLGCDKKCNQVSSGEREREREMRLDCVILQKNIRCHSWRTAADYLLEIKVWHSFGERFSPPISRVQKVMSFFLHHFPPLPAFVCVVPLLCGARKDNRLGVDVNGRSFVPQSSNEFNSSSLLLPFHLLLHSHSFRCVCVCVWWREKRREEKGERERECLNKSGGAVGRAAQTSLPPPIGSLDLLSFSFLFFSFLFFIFLLLLRFLFCQSHLFSFLLQVWRNEELARVSLISSPQLKASRPVSSRCTPHFISPFFFLFYKRTH